MLRSNASPQQADYQYAKGGLSLPGVVTLQDLKRLVLCVEGVTAVVPQKGRLWVGHRDYKGGFQNNELERDLKTLLGMYAYVGSYFEIERVNNVCFYLLIPE